MLLKTSPASSCRFECCTLTGALSVTSSVRDSVSIVHGPDGCAHHNFSLLHTIALDQGNAVFPRIISSGMRDTEVVFGGEDALRAAIRDAARQGVSLVFVLSSCIAETIGDDVTAVCGEKWGIPVVRVPTAGFLGGSFCNGVNNALVALAAAAPGSSGPCIEHTANLIGEKNLEYEVEENYGEIVRLLSLLSISVNIRFVRNIAASDIRKLGGASLNILREPGMDHIGNELLQKFNTPLIDSFPSGFSGTLEFIATAGAACEIDWQDAVGREREYQQSVLSGFSDISGSFISPFPEITGVPSSGVIREVAGALGIRIGKSGTRVPVPYDPPVGTCGIARMLHRWRCALHA